MDDCIFCGTLENSTFSEKEKGIIKFKILEDIDKVRKFVKEKYNPLQVFLVTMQVKGDRSEKQNRLFFAIITRIAKQTGQSKELIKEGLKMEYGPTYAWKGYDLPKSLTLYSKEEFSMIIEGAIKEAMENNVYIDDIITWRKE